MTDFQLTHTALVGARIAAFSDHGITNRIQLKMRRVAPGSGESELTELSPQQRQEALSSQFPIWVHNIITDPDFPKRRTLLMALRRFEGELRDNKEDEVISAVMSAGFKSENFDPLSLPQDMPMSRRCSIVAQINVWKEAYERLEDEVTQILSAEASAITQWVESARKPGHSIIEEV